MTKDQHGGVRAKVWSQAQLLSRSCASHVTPPRLGASSPQGGGNTDLCCVFLQYLPLLLAPTASLSLVDACPRWVTGQGIGPGPPSFRRLQKLASSVGLLCGLCPLSGSWRTPTCLGAWLFPPISLMPALVLTPPSLMPPFLFMTKWGHHVSAESSPWRVA